MNKRILLSAFFMFVWLQGCAVIPIMEDEPFKDKSVTELEPGQVNKADVLIALGDPAIVYDQENVFLYTDDQVHAVWFIIAGGVGGAGAIGGVIATRYFLVFEFDEQGQVARRAAIPYGVQHDWGTTSSTGPSCVADLADGKACVPSGLCIADNSGLKVFATTKRDADAKAFKPSSRCTVYAYRDDSGEKKYMGAIYVFRLRFDHQFAGMLYPDGYHRFEVAPGHHEIAIDGRFIASREQLTTPPNFERVRFRCKAGDIRYVRFHTKTGSNWMGYLNFSIEAGMIEAGMIEAEQARVAILKKRLVLNPTVNGEKAIW